MQATAEEVKEFAKFPTKPVSFTRTNCIPIELEVDLQNGCRATLRSTSKQDDVQRSFIILDNAASVGDQIVIDEFPTLEVYKNQYLINKQLIMIEDKEGDILGVAFVGPSHLSRSSGSPNASLFVYLLPEHRRKGYGSEVLDVLEQHAEEMQFTSILVDLFMSKTLPYQFLKYKGYTHIGSISCSGYIQGQGWTDCLVFFKNFTSNQLLANL